MAYTNLAFCWNGIVSTDVDRAKGFYTKVLGWDVMEHTFDNGDTATMFAAQGTPLAHLRAPQGDQEPNHWTSYLRVADVDASTAAATANGGTLLTPPTDIPPGRFSVIKTPSGAPLCLFLEADASATDGPTGLGGIHWTELHSTNIDADLAWLKSTFGYTTSEMPMPNGVYYLLNDGETQIGGAMASPNPGAPAMWLPWVQVADVDRAVTLSQGEGGTTLVPANDMPGIGRMAIVADPTGATFGVITPPAG